MLAFRKFLLRLLLILVFGTVPAILCQFFAGKPVERNIHITSFRYGKDPSVIRCNRGDRLNLTFKTLDTGHSFFLEEFDVDAKISPARDEVEVFKTSDPTEKSYRTKVISIHAQHKGISKYLVSKSIYRCHVWCGPMHAFESGKLIIMPNTLLMFSLGCAFGIGLLWLIGLFRQESKASFNTVNDSPYRDVLTGTFLKKAVTSRWPQIIITLVAMLMIYVVILTSIFGTQMSGRNLGVLLMWAIWLFLLVALLTPFLGRIWCTICPLPFFGDFLQRKSFFNPLPGNSQEYNNEFAGKSLKWPDRLKNNWLKLFAFMALATFSTTLVARPKVSGLVVLCLLLVPTFMALVFELRAFCRYICPVGVFVGPFSGMSTLAVRNKSQDVCNKCSAHFCKRGSKSGWACPYGINVGEMKENADCGVCLECLRSCSYKNVSLFSRPFATELGTRNYSEAWLVIAIFTLSVVYSVLYEGHWPVVRDYVNILDKKNWDLFGIYALILWVVTLVIIPAILCFLSYAGTKMPGVIQKTGTVFLSFTGALLPLGLMLWIAFVIPMLFVNATFIIQSFSDPFGWGWDFFGTASIPWHQLMPGYIPWFQAVLVLIGLFYSLRNLARSGRLLVTTPKSQLLLVLPVAVFIFSVSAAMLFFYTN